jgi:hypothetical protein
MAEDVIKMNVSQINSENPVISKKSRYGKLLQRTFLSSMILILFMAGVYTGKNKIVPIVNTRSEYMIGMYSGSSPFSLKPFNKSNPVVTAAMVTDVQAGFVADPFMINHQGRWYMFFEIMKEPQHKGVIGVASSTDLQTWKYDKVILEEPFHLSYPMVFQYNGEMFMIPESHSNYEVSIYKADNFPYGWKKHRTLIEGNYSDPTVFYHDNHWFLFAVDRDDILHLFWADDLMGPWYVHPKSPIVKFDYEKARSCGRVITAGDTIIRFTQNCKPGYGMDIRAFIITEITPENYQEKPYINNPLLKGTGVITDWNGIRMHQIDLHKTGKDQWVAVTDGVGRWSEYGLGLFGEKIDFSIGPRISLKTPYRK